MTLLLLGACGRPDAADDLASVEQAICADPEGCPIGGTGPVGAPTSLRLVTLSPSLVSVGYVCGGNADRHTLLAREDGTSTTVRVSSRTGCPSTLSDVRVEPGKRYCWSVEARNTESSKVSSLLCATVPLDPNPVAAPKLVITSYDTDTVSFEVTDQSDNEGGFRLWGKRVGSSLWQVLSAWPRATRREPNVGEVLRVQDHRFGPDQAWDFAAESYKEFAPASGWSATLRLTTLPLPPTAPGNVRITSVEEHAVTLQWDDSLNEDQYRIDAAITGNPDKSATAGIDATEHRFTGLPSGAHICFTVSAVNRNTSAPGANRPCTTTLVTQSDLDATLTLVPVPPETGLIPFVGGFPSFGIATGMVTRIEFASALNPSSLVAMSFIKPQDPTSACADTSKRVTLTPGQSLTAAELTKLYGSATPSLPINLKACVSISNTQTIPSPTVRIYWHGT